MLAACSGHCDTADILIKAGADVNIEDKVIYAAEQ